MKECVQPFIVLLRHKLSKRTDFTNVSGKQSFQGSVFKQVLLVLNDDWQIIKILITDQKGLRIMQASPF